MSSMLFSPIAVGGMTLSNRIVIAPMCQYSAIDGTMTDWHVMHLGSLALSGASMLVIEATGVRADGRITPGCTGLYSDANEEAMKRTVDFVRSISPIRIGIQLAHAGRKASAERPWDGRGPLTADRGAWQTVGPSAIPFTAGWHTPKALDRAGMDDLCEAFVAATKRSARLGLDFVEVHSTHGYLLSQFLSPLSNRREDEYGGGLENRMRFPLEVMRAVRSAWPAEKPLGAKISGTDFADGGWTPDDAVAYASALKNCGLDFVTLSGGGVSADAKVPTSPGYQVPFAERVKKEVGITTGAVGLITSAAQAEQILTEGKADLIAIARAMLFDPRWGCHAAVSLEGEAYYPPQYERSGPKLWPPAREWKS